MSNIYSKKSFLTGHKSCVVFIFSLICSVSLRGQQNLSTPQKEDSLAFNIATIKPMKIDGSSFNMMIMNPLHMGQFRATGITMRRLLNLAYDKQGRDIEGGPAWIDADLYEVNAKADDSVNQQLAAMSDGQARLTRQAMLQSLLAERCHLKMNTVARTTNLYSLVRAKTGSKLKRVDGPGSSAQEKDMTIQVSGDTISFFHAPILKLLEILSQETHHHIEDKTELPGLYDFSLNFQRERPGSSIAEFTGPSLETALAQQLGLRLESQKGPSNQFVIESISKPLPF